MDMSTRYLNASNALKEKIVEAAGFVYEDDAWTITNEKVIVAVEKELKSIPRFLTITVAHSPHSYSTIKGVLTKVEYDILTFTLEHEYLKSGR